VQVAGREDSGEHPPGDQSQEPEAAQVGFLGREDVLAERLRADVPEIVAVMRAVAARDDEEHVRHRGRDPVGDAHEHVEPPHRLEAARHVGDDAHVVRNGFAADPARSRFPAPERRVHAVVDDVDFGPPRRR
jgi:hypothetical protein